jgi:hypothetical protein
MKRNYIKSKIVLGRETLKVLTGVELKEIIAGSPSGGQPVCVTYSVRTTC